MLARTETVTLLFTDIEGSTPLWEKQTDLMQAALTEHDDILRQAIEDSGGAVFKTVGDAFCAVFRGVNSAVSAAVDAQTRLAATDWGEIGSIRVRMAIHTGDVETRDADYFGPALSRVARILGCGFGGQILLSQAAARLLDERTDGRALRDLGEHVLRGLEAPERIYQLVDQALPQTFPPLRASGAAIAHHLPSYRTSFVGRGADINRITAALQSRDVQLLTLTGPGGSGKTRLAVEAGGALRDHFEGGVHFVPLAGITASAEVPGAVAQVLGVRDAGDAGVIQRLATYLQEHHALLILDNLEHLEGVSHVVAGLLSSPAVTVLATSRSPLHLYGEQELPVPPLALPATPAAHPSDLPAEAEAVSLFVSRARAVLPTFVLTSAHAPIIAEICRRLDGLPLAIELAAPRVKVLSLEGILSRLDNRLALLTAGPGDQDRRQQTLRAAIDWSHDLLNDKERTLFRRLAVFRGGFTIEAVESVCPDDACTPVEVFDVMTSLVDKSLLQRRESSAGSDRFVLLQTIREYADERLEEAGERARIAHCHARHFAASASELCPELQGFRQAENLKILAAETENLRQSLAWFADSGLLSDFAAMAVSLERLWQIQGEYSEGRAWLERALASPESELDQPVRARALLASGVLAWRQGDGPGGRSRLEHAVAMLRELGDATALGRALANLAMAAWVAGEPSADGERLCAEAETILREFDDRIGLADALHLLGHMVIESGQLARAQSVWEESFSLSQEMGDRWGGAPALKDLGLVASRRGDLRLARRLYEESLAILRETGEKGYVADSLNRLGELSLFEHAHADALQRFDEAMGLMRELGNAAGYIETLNRIAEVTALGGDLPQARQLYQECLETSRRIGNDRLVAGMLNNLGNVALCEGRAAGAVALFLDSARIHGELARDAGVAIALEGLALAQASLGEMKAAAATVGRASTFRDRAGSSFDPFDRIEHSLGRQKADGWSGAPVVEEELGKALGTD